MFYYIWLLNKMQLAGNKVFIIFNFCFIVAFGWRKKLVNLKNKVNGRIIKKIIDLMVETVFLPKFAH